MQIRGRRLFFTYDFEDFAPWITYDFEDLNTRITYDFEELRSFCSVENGRCRGKNDAEPDRLSGERGSFAASPYESAVSEAHKLEDQTADGGEQRNDRGSHCRMKRLLETSGCSTRRRMMNIVAKVHLDHALQFGDVHARVGYVFPQVGQSGWHFI